MKRKVRVKGPGVKLNNKWCYINDEAIIDEQVFEKNKEYVDVIEKIEEPKISEGEGTSKDENEVDDTNIGDNEGENSGEGEENEDKELEALKARAKELNIKVTANMKKETIIKKIEEKEAETGEGQNPEGE